MKSSKLLLPIALVSALTIGMPNISALGRPYNGEEWMTIDPSSGRVTLYPIDGVQMSQNEDGTINLDTSIPNDTSKWDSQVSGVGSTQSYIYVGFHIKPVEGAVKLKSTCDAVNNTMDSALRGDFVKSKSSFVTRSSKSLLIFPTFYQVVGEATMLRSSNCHLELSLGEFPQKHDGRVNVVASRDGYFVSFRSRFFNSNFHKSSFR